MSTDAKAGAKETTADVLSAMQKHLPGVMSAVSKEFKPIALQEALAAEAASPILSRSGYNILREYGPKTAQASADINAILQRAAAERELGISRGVGEELVKRAGELQRILDPEAYRATANTERAIAQLLEASRPGLIEGEREEIRRGMGFVNRDSALDTVANAMQFGRAYREGLGRLANAIQVASSSIPAMRSGISGFTTATTRQVNSPSYLERVPTVTPNLGVDAALPIVNNVMQGGYQAEVAKANRSPRTEEIAGRVIGAIAAGVMGI